jgi:N-acetylneuraminic acid mutarotase
MTWVAFANALAGCALLDAAGSAAPTQDGNPSDGPRADGAIGAWIEHRHLPSARGNPQTVAHGTDIFAISGNPNSSINQAYSTIGDAWSTKRDVPTAVANASAATVGDRIFIAGGILANSNCDSQIQIYDVTANSWSSMPFQTMCRHGAGVVGTKIWFTGGALGSICSFETVSDMFGSCSTQPFPSPGTRQFASVVAIGNSIYLMGGQDNGGTHFDNVDVYDTVADTWTSETPLPRSRGEAAAVVAAGKIYMIGGRRDGGATVIDDVDIFDPTTHQWTSGPKLPRPLFDLGAAVVGNQLYIIGGADLTQEYDGVYSLTAN